MFSTHLSRQSSDQLISLHRSWKRLSWGYTQEGMRYWNKLHTKRRSNRTLKDSTSECEFHPKKSHFKECSSRRRLRLKVNNKFFQRYGREKNAASSRNTDITIDKEVNCYNDSVGLTSTKTAVTGAASDKTHVYPFETVYAASQDIGKSDEFYEKSTLHSTVSDKNASQDVTWKLSEQILSLLDEQDRPPELTYNVSKVLGLSKIQCLLLICESSLYVIHHFQKNESNISEVMDTNQEMEYNVGIRSHGWVSLPAGVGIRKETKSTLPRSTSSATPGSDEPLQQNVRTSSDISFNTNATGHTGLDNSIKGHKVIKLPFIRVQQFHTRQHLLRRIAIEFFDTNGENFFLAFESQMRMEEVWNHMCRVNLPNNILHHMTKQLSRRSIERLHVHERHAGNAIAGIGDISTQSQSQSQLGGGTAASDGGTGSRYKPTVNLSSRWKQWRNNLTQKWVNGQIDNFEYLMNLNTLAGRTYNDLTQYPVFPWILADYTSETLDFSDPKTFRDLSKPMGTQSPARAKQFEERYELLSSMKELGSPYHYGTHYSCAGYVLYYLVRLEPFSRMGLQLQGGHFDQPDRLFHDIGHSWNSAASANQQDVRELIPEFFYLPEFLVNSNKFELGTRQDGTVIDNIVLPPWAHGDPNEFIRLHRYALESPFVSENIHLWIDLIFGSNQRGESAVSRVNVFHPLTYEGSVDIDSIADPVLRASTQSQIQEFGQTPKQIFTAPHPKKKIYNVYKPLSSGAGNSALVETLHSFWIAPCMVPRPMAGGDYMSLGPISVPFDTGSKASGTACYKREITDIQETADGRLVVVQPLINEFHCFSSNNNNNNIMNKVTGYLLPPTYSKYISWNYADGGVHLHVATPSVRRREVDKVVSVHECLHSRVTALTVTQDGQYVITGGQDAIIQIWNYKKVTNLLSNHGHSSRSLRLLGSISMHRSPISSLAVSRQLGLIVSGSVDGESVLWDLEELSLVKRLLPGGRSDAIVMCVDINDTNTLTLTISGQVLDLWNCNGDHHSTVDLSSPHVCLSRPSHCILTPCPAWKHGVTVITGHPDGSIVLWGLLYPADFQKSQKNEKILKAERKIIKDDVNITEREKYQEWGFKKFYNSRIN